MTPRALIVDDSKTAQIRLKKMLDQYDLSVDTATSAEDALVYLESVIPAVIFMDHHMQGMDGLQALQLIKANLSTAMIPVIMYTSESGDIYTGQALALGALDILSKDSIKPANLERVLAKFSIFPKTLVANPSQGQTSAAVETAPAVNSPVSEAVLESLLDRYDSRWEEQVETLTQRMNATLAAEQQKIMRVLASQHKLQAQIEQRNAAAAEKAAAPRGSAPLVSVSSGELPPPSNNRSALWYGVQITVVALIAYGLFVLQGSLNGFQQQLQQVERLIATANSAQPVKTQAAMQVDEVPARSTLVEMINSILGLNFHYDYNDQPLSDSRVKQLGQLIELLDESGFRGTLNIRVHQGNYCLARSSTNEFVLADPGSGLNECRFLADDLLPDQLDELESPAFTRLLQTSTPILNGNIAIQLKRADIAALDQPATMDSTAVTAGQWNLEQQYNNFLSVAFVANVSFAEAAR